MAQIRDELILADRFSNVLRNYASGLGAAAREARAAYLNMTAAQGQAAAAAASSARQVQYEAANMADSIARSSGSGVNAVRMYAQEIVGADQQLARMSMEAAITSQRLTEVAGAQGADSAAARELTSALAGQVEQMQAVRDHQSRARAMMEDAAGGTKQAARALDQYRNSANQANTSTSGLVGMVRNLAGAFLGLRGVNALGGLSDSMVQTRARLDILTGGEGTDQLQKMIYESAQRSRGDYMGTADMVSKMGIMAGEAFHNDPRELVAFTETLNKMYTVSGTNQAGQQAATLQLEQAMAMGVLRGQEFRSVVQQVPMLVQAIADSLDVSTGEVKKMADEGLITASVVKNAMFSAADEVNAKFETMPMTWGQVWTSMKNTALMAAQPLLDGINFLANNIEVIGPIVLGVAAAFGTYAAVIVAKNAVEAISNGLTAVSAAHEAIKAGLSIKAAAATQLASGAQVGYNAALLASPITWIIGGIILLVVALYAGVGAFNKFTGASVSATGIIAGTFLALGAQVLNMTLVPMQNGFANFANFFGNLFNDPVAAVQVLFYDLADTVLGYVATVAHGMEDLINKIPGMKVDLTSGIDGIRAMVQGASQDVKDASGWTEYVKKWDYFNLSGAFTYGYEKGANFNPLGDLMNFGEGFDLSGMAEDIGSIAGDTKKLTANMADEDLKYMEDLATRRYETHVNSTSLTPQVTVRVEGNADKGTADDIAGRIAAILRREASAQTSISYAEV